MRSKPYILSRQITLNTVACHNALAEADENSLGSKEQFPLNKYVKIKRIVVADDDPAIIDVLTLMLEAAGYEIFASANKKTFADITRIRPDLVLLDIAMSGINGHDICIELKNQPSTKHIPVIMISAKKDAKEITLNAGADDFIAKPFEMHKLLEKVEQFNKV